MINQQSVFSNVINKEPLSHEEVQKKYQECSKKHGLVQAQNGQNIKIYGCEQCKVYFFKTSDGWHLKHIQESQYRLFGFKEESTEPKSPVLKECEDLIASIPKGQIKEINISPDQMGLLNFIIDNRKNPIFKSVEIKTYPMRITIKKL